MKKNLSISAISLAVLVILLLFCRFTGILNYYHIATASNEPTLKMNSIVFASNLKKPGRFDFIFYKQQNPKYGAGIWIHRICGLAGDKIQLINGELFVNNQRAGSAFETYHNYTISSSDFARVNKELKFTEDEAFFISPDSVTLPLQKQTIKDYHLAATPFFAEDYNDEIFGLFKERWTADNFGPYTVPANSYFVLGDNRNNSLDSRYIGCISRDDVVATKLGAR